MKKDNLYRETVNLMGWWLCCVFSHGSTFLVYTSRGCQLFAISVSKLKIKVGRIEIAVSLTVIE